MIRLTTTRLILRDPVRTDLDGWHRLFSDAGNLSFVPDLVTRSRDETLQRLEEAMEEARHADRTRYFFTVQHRDSGLFLGSVGFTVKDENGRRIADTGYFLLSEHQGRGYAVEAMTEMIRFIQAEGIADGIRADCFIDNHASEAVMRRCGMQPDPEAAPRRLGGEWKPRVTYRLVSESRG